MKSLEQESFVSSKKLKVSNPRQDQFMQASVHFHTKMPICVFDRKFMHGTQTGVLKKQPGWRLYGLAIGWYLMELHIALEMTWTDMVSSSKMIIMI